MFSTPDVIINRQHEKLIQLLTDMSLTVTNEDTEYLLIPKFAKFLMYLEDHFAYEESAMNRSGYFDLDDHKEVHRQFLATVNKIYRNAMRNTASLKDSLPIVVRALTNHIELEEAVFRTELLPSLQSNFAEFS